MSVDGAASWPIGTWSAGWPPHSWSGSPATPSSGTHRRPPSPWRNGTRGRLGRKALLLVEYGKPTAAFFDSHDYAFMIPLPHAGAALRGHLLPVGGGNGLQGPSRPILDLLHRRPVGVRLPGLAGGAPAGLVPTVGSVGSNTRAPWGCSHPLCRRPDEPLPGAGCAAGGPLARQPPDWRPVGRSAVLAAAANTKNEGLAAAMAVLLVAAVVAGVAARKTACVARSRPCSRQSPASPCSSLHGGCRPAPTRSLAISRCARASTRPSSSTTPIASGPQSPR